MKFARQIIFALAFAATAFGQTTLPTAVSSSIDTTLKSAAIVGPVTVSAPGYLVTTVPAAPVPAIVNKTPVVTNGATTTLAAGQTYPGQLVFNGHANATVTCVVTSPATIPATIQAAATPAGSGSPATAITYWSDTNNCTLSNINVSSSDGNGQAANVRGTNIKIINVGLKGLSEGFDYTGPVNGLTITGGSQTGAVAGRCHFFLNVTNLTWTGSTGSTGGTGSTGSTGGVFGPASKQSPIRFSYPGVTGGTITGVTGTQVGSPFPIAAWAVHDAHNVTWTNCNSVGADFSCGTAGGGGNIVDSVGNCTFTNMTVTNGKFCWIDKIVTGCTINGGTFVDPEGEGITLDCTPTAGNKINGANIYSDHEAIVWNAADNTVVSNTTLFTTNASLTAANMFTGAFNSKVNDGGGNKVVRVATLNPE